MADIRAGKRKVQISLEHLMPKHKFSKNDRNMLKDYRSQIWDKLRIEINDSIGL